PRSSTPGSSFFFSSRRRHTSFSRDWSSDVCSSDLVRVAPLRGESGVERLFTAVPERRVADVMRQAQCLREILVEAECPGDDSPDLGNLKAMRQANPEMVAVRRNENLGLSGETPERDRMDDAVAVALERAARTAASFVLVGELASARRGRVGGV